MGNFQKDFAFRDLVAGGMFPYDAKDVGEDAVPTGWEYTAARGVLRNLGGRSAIGNALESVDDYDIRKEIVEYLAEIIRQAAGETRGVALRDVQHERARQDAQWGEQNHDPFTYLTILMEEVGELSQAALHNRFGGSKGSVEHLREEAVQTAAVALAIVECLDRGKWVWPTKEGDAVSDLLAVLHRDGGHYEGEHGREQAAKDALEIVQRYRQVMAENDLL